MFSSSLFTLLYLFFCCCVIAPPQEVVSAGLTVQNLFDWWCGSEELNFIYYHVRRSTVTAVLHSFLPLGYVILPAVFDPHSYVASFVDRSALWICFDIIAAALFAVVAYTSVRWSRDNWNRHPIATKLSHLATQGSSWRAVASSVNVEFRRPDKFSTGLYSRRIYITDSWIVHTATYTIDVAPLSDVILTLSASQNLPIVYDQPHGAQFLSIRVTCVNAAVKPFDIRLNARDYNDLKDRLQAPIRNVQGIAIQQSLADLFLVVFREQVNVNGKYRLPIGYSDVEQQCIGCMVAEANVKLVKRCGGGQQPAPDAASECHQCYCRPQWCVDCVGKWFAHRQPQDEPGSWLAGKAPCPMCRATFCAVDVCLLES